MGLNYTFICAIFVEIRNYNMPEGPSIPILKDQLKPFKNKRVTSIRLRQNVDPSMLEGNTVTAIKTWGKQLLISFKGFTIRVHMGLFGSYKINSHGKRNASLHLQFGDEEVNLHRATIMVIKGPLSKAYDFSADIMSSK